MGLDIAILDDEGYPADYITIGVDEHWKMIELANKENLSLIKRMNNYYGDADFSYIELTDLLKEFELVSTNPSLRNRALEVIELCRQALIKGKGLNVLAD